MQRGSGGGMVGGVSARGGGARCLLHPGLEDVDLHATDATLRRRAAEVRRAVLEISQPPFQATFDGESRSFKDDTAHVERSVGLQSDLDAAGEPLSTQRLEPSDSGGQCRNFHTRDTRAEEPPGDELDPPQARQAVPQLGKHLCQAACVGALLEAKVNNAVGEVVVIPVVTSRVRSTRVPQGQQVRVLNADRVASSPSSPWSQQRPVAATVGIARHGVAREHLNACSLAGGAVAVRVPEAAAADAQPCTRRSVPAARHRRATPLDRGTTSVPRNGVLPGARCGGLRRCCCYCSCCRCCCCGKSV